MIGIKAAERRNLGAMTMTKARSNVQLSADQGLQEAAAQYVWNKVHGKPMPETPAEQRALEQFRVTLDDLGPGLAEVAVRCCCFEQGLEKTEQIMGWSARSGKIVLRIALQRLKRYYDKLHGAGGGMIG